MHRLLIAAAAASVLSMSGAAQAGGSGGYSGGSYASPCGCQGYGSAGGYGYSDEAPYVDEDDGYYARSYGYESYDYVPFESSTYGYSYEDVYGRGDYSYDRRDYDAPRHRSYSYSYDDSRRRTPQAYGYRTYHYASPRYSRPTYRYRPHYGHSSTDGERG